ncbi:MAG: serine hydrolase [Bacteroidales bacterium]|nr:serine hydrolase [Bacteroidales bacterium]
MKRLFVFVISLIIPLCCYSQGALRMANPERCGFDRGRLSQVDRVIEEAISDKTIPGAVVSVVKGDKIAYLKAYGNRALVPEVEPMTEETMFDLASVSKCVGTTLSFMQLIENGFVRLTDRVDMYIPGFKPWVDPETGESVDITIRDLMTHSSGLDAYVVVDDYVAEYGELTPNEFETYIATKVNRNFKPGTKCLYSCLNFVTLQRILERVTGERVCDYAQSHIFTPLGLKHTTYLPDDELKKMCAPTEVQADGLPLRGEVHDPLARRIMGGNSGNAGLFSNARDLSVICAMIMNGGELPKGGTRILGPLTIDLMCEIPIQNDPMVGRALGWDKDGWNPGTRGDIFDPETSIWHTGYTGPSVVIDMKTKTALIILTNRVHPEDKGSLARLRAQVANIVAGAVTHP